MSDPGSQTDARQAMERILASQSVGHLGLTDAGEVYVVPLNYTYSRGRILFHCALEGRKLDMIRANPRVCFEVSCQGAEPLPHGGDPCDTPFESVICWGTARIVEDLSERRAILDEFQMRFEKPGGPREPVPMARVERCGAVEIAVSRMTGRRGLGHRPERWEWVA
ncbi:MAG TPA: pyridoxamine 5'-phosphate oxidase family protein [Armatimonadota bacterium]|nr:pyridoxamine 5'-phosphate oxidase family protein [Armatimonadota bacterium]HQK96017.1 pyridoxamine 5'-phosphate oxidase family protein [Armatimonadota bacterium]